ncbi:MAG: sigma-54 dependent transcriptional regulator [Nitrospirota bacterium]|nr:sigma-54 dependent transcriptional regulator [Nitrospirota bacterium]
MRDRKKVLIVDAEADSIRAFSEMLSKDGYDVFGLTEAEADTAINEIPEYDIAAVITDAGMHCRDGTQVFDYVKENHPAIPVILLTGHGNDGHAFSALTRGAFCCFKKLPEYTCLKGVLDRAVELRSLKKEVEALKKGLPDENLLYRIIGSSGEMRKIIEIIEAVKDSDSNVLIHGEAGSGKELIARAISGCRKKKGPFISLNCSVMPEELIAEELFGREKESFPGAFSRKTGKFEEAFGGTLFLDEIGYLGLSLQAKLLKVLQEKDVRRPGNNRKTRADFRLLSSTKRDLKKEAQQGNFMEDLLNRINQIEINVPPLRERKDDIPLLVSAFFNEFSAREQKVLTISDKVMKMFENFYWPGNVKQLRNVVERAVMLARGDKITPRDLPEELLSTRRPSANCNALKTFRELEKEALKDALEFCKGNKSKASRLLGISRKAMYKRLREIQI